LHSLVGVVGLKDDIVLGEDLLVLFVAVDSDLTASVSVKDPE